MQLSPHFLFNTLNNICSLARKKSEKTETALIKLSEFMRYMMDETKEDKVSLSKEIEYLQNYIELQRLRFTEGIKIDFKVMGDSTPVMIEPMLLIPFVENAFKHGIGVQEESEIWIDLSITGDKLIFTVQNQIHPYLGENLPDEHGIGLRNVKRRLELLYPGSHDLTITDDNNIYKVILEIRLK
jgi:LytS/YehU family sensor histidine kinase